MTLSIESAQPADKQIVVAMLEQAQLLTEDLPDDLSCFLIARNDETPVGVAGLELFGSVGLLRSIAVDPSYQGKGIANRLVKQILTNAGTAHLQEVYLITTTADHYFDRYGFAPVDRGQVPQTIQQTRQFSGLCPSSAVVMKCTVAPETV